MLRVVFELCMAFLAVWGWYRLLTDKKRRSRFFSGEPAAKAVWLYDAESAEYRLRRALSEARSGDTILVYLPQGAEELRKIAGLFAKQYPNIQIIPTETDET